jgi:thiol-disulfide isomerase/thioredoxin
MISKRFYPGKIVLAFIILIIAVTIGCEKKASPAPIFDLILYESKDYKNNEKYTFNPNNNKITMINFWFPSCPPCISEMPDIDSAYLKYKDRIDVIGVQLIGIDSINDGKRFIEKGGFSYAIGGDKQGKISVDYDVTLFPTTLFIDHTGHIFESWQGIIEEPEIAKIITSILNTER